MVLDPTIATVDYDPQWAAKFEIEKSRLTEALGGVAARVEHIGSTAVSGLAAKPIIDIDVYVRAIEPMAPYREPLEALGYIFQFDRETPRLHFFGYPAQRPRLFHVHVAELGGQHMEADLAVRDFLRTHLDVAAEYAAIEAGTHGRAPWRS
jgi:GrpB-like predicted nucleotidyltransferase (UPF0157 family)